LQEHGIDCNKDTNNDRFYECTMTDDEYKGLNDMIITMKDQDGLPFNYVI